MTDRLRRFTDWMTRATRSTVNSSVAARTAKRMASIKGFGLVILPV